MTYDPVTDSILDTIFTDRYFLKPFWLTEQIVAASVSVEGMGFTYLTFDLEGQVLDTLPMGSGNVSSNNKDFFAYYESSPREIVIYDTNFDTVSVFPRPSSGSFGIKMTWIDDERLILQSPKAISILISLFTHYSIITTKQTAVSGDASGWGITISALVRTGFWNWSESRLVG